MSTQHTSEPRHSLEQALNDLEAVADDIRVKIHLAGMDARDAWDRDLEPRFQAARQHARQAKASSKAVLESTLAALRDFQKTL